MASNTAPMMLYFNDMSQQGHSSFAFPCARDKFEFSSDLGYIWQGVTQQRRSQGTKIQVEKTSWDPHSFKYFPLKCKQNEKDFSTPSQAAATAGPWVTNQSHCLWLLWPGEELCDTELAETGVKWWEFHEQNPGRPGLNAKDDDVKGTAKSKLVIWRQQHLHF